MADMTARPTAETRILVVEDEPALRRLFVEVLRREAYEVDQADSGEAALTLLETADFDIVISDMQMRQLSGLDVLEMARRKDPSTQVIIITGHASIGTAVRAIRQGAYEYLTKPVQPQALTIKVKNAIERRQLLLTLAEQEEALRRHHELIERDLVLARQVQASLVPTGFSTPGLDVGIRYVPMIGLGGDFADIVAVDDQHIFLAVIDVTGHGIAAALLVSRICHEWRRQVLLCRDPAAVLWQLNDFFLDTFFETPLFLTMMVVECDLKNRQLRYAGSAHPAALLWRCSSRTFVRLDPQNAIIGFARGDAASFRSGTMPYEAGDRLMLYTDGAIEAENQHGKPLGLHGVQQIIRRQMQTRPAIKAADAIIDEVIAFSRDALGDDVLMMVAHLQ